MISKIENAARKNFDLVVMGLGFAELRAPLAPSVVMGQTVRSVFKKHGVRMYEYANVGNHLHMAIKLHSRRTWGPVIRELTGRIAFALGTRGERYWSKLPFTRVAAWGRAFQTLLQYVRVNQMEADGYCTRKDLKVLNELHESWGWSTA